MLSMKCVSMKILFQKSVFNKMLSKKFRNSMMVKKAMKPRLLIIFVGRIEQQQLLDISAD